MYNRFDTDGLNYPAYINSHPNRHARIPSHGNCHGTGPLKRRPASQAEIAAFNPWDWEDFLS